MAKSLFSDAHKKVVAVLVAARHDSGLRQVDLAKKIGKDQSFVSNVERLERRVDLVEFIVLARAMKTDPVELFAQVVRKLPAKVEI